MGSICFNAQSARLGDATDSMKSRELDATSFPMKLIELLVDSVHVASVEVASEYDKP